MDASTRSYGEYRLVVFRFITLLVVYMLAFSANARQPEKAVGVLVGPMDSDRRNDDEAWTLAIGKSVRDKWTVVPPFGQRFVFKPGQSCQPSDLVEVRRNAIESITEGRRLFFEETDLETSVREMAVDSVLDRGCLLADESFRPIIAEAGLLGVRINLLLGRPEAAVAQAMKLVLAFSETETATVDLPPDVSEFIKKIRDDMASAGQFELQVKGGSGTADGPIILADGRLLKGRGPFMLEVGTGTRNLLVLLDSARTARLSVTPSAGTATIVDLSVARCLVPFADGSWHRLLPDKECSIETVDEGLRAFSHDDLLVVDTTKDTLKLMSMESGHDDDGPRSMVELGHVEKKTALEGVLHPVAGSKLDTRSPWPWPWVSGALSLGLSVTGVVLNVKANSLTDEVNFGRNVIDDRDAFVAGSIACYSLSGVSAVTALVLALVAPSASMDIRVAPSDDGAIVGLSSRF